MWSDFDELIKDEDKNIPLLSYIHACNPHNSEEDKTGYADALISELFQYVEHFNAPEQKDFVGIVIWDVRELISDKEALEKVAKIYFEGRETEEEYQDIQEVLGIKNENIEEIKATLEKLTTIFEEYDRFDGVKDKDHLLVISILEKLTPEVLLGIAKNIQNKQLATSCFKYLWTAEIENKKEALVRLFIYIETRLSSGFKVTEEFFITDKNDPNIEFVKEVCSTRIHKSDFVNPNDWEDSKQGIARFFKEIAHYPNIFDFLIKTINQSITIESRPSAFAIFTTLFSNEDSREEINPALKFSKEQLEKMMDTISDWLLKCDYQDDQNYHTVHDKGMNCFNLKNPLAKDWIKRHSNEEWVNQFSHIKMKRYATLNEELKSTFKMK